MEHDIEAEGMENDSIELIDRSVQSMNINGMENSSGRLEQNAYDKYHNILKHVIHYHTHFTILVCFEIMFYFNFIVGYEKSVILNVVKDIIEKIQEVFGYLDDDDVYNRRDELCNSGLSDGTQEHNDKLYEKAMYIILSLVGFLIILMLVETNILKKHSSVPYEFLRSLILVAFVALFDYVFFIYFIAEYRILGGVDVLCEFSKSA